MSKISSDGGSSSYEDALLDILDILENGADDDDSEQTLKRIWYRIDEEFKDG